ncbi:MAG: hypothetical protein AAF908_01295 [Pseudomonadota bacterium]
MLDRRALGDDRIFRGFDLALPAEEPGDAAVRDLAAQLCTKPESVTVLMLHRHLDRALQIFPGTPVVHMLRDPRDVARSCIGMGWAGDVYHGVDGWIDTERGWDRAAPLLGEAPGF